MANLRAESTLKLTRLICSLCCYGNGGGNPRRPILQGFTRNLNARLLGVGIQVSLRFGLSLRLRDQRSSMNLVLSCRRFSSSVTSKRLRKKYISQRLKAATNGRISFRRGCSTMFLELAA